MSLQQVFELDTAAAGDRTLAVRPRAGNNSFLVRITPVSGSPSESVTVKYEVDGDGDYRTPSTGTPIVDLSDPHDVILPSCITGIQFDASGATDTYTAKVISCNT